MIAETRLRRWLQTDREYREHRHCLTYEGIAFRALVPTQGSCYPGTVPVWRLYNDRFAQADSNHRFVTSADTYRHMIANGRIGEGVAFCSPED